MNRRISLDVPPFKAGAHWMRSLHYGRDDSVFGRDGSVFGRDDSVFGRDDRVFGRGGSVFAQTKPAYPITSSYPHDAY